MIGLTKALAKDFAEYGVRVNCLAPGVIRTSFAEILVDAIEAKEKNPIDAADIGKDLAAWPHAACGGATREGVVAALLCSADASFVTGEVLVAAGGVNARR
jgi:dehydrogenase/reductase SDR family protein 4